MSEWTWVYHDAASATIRLAELPSPDFQCQADAEPWVGENWRALLAEGVDSVSLLEGDRTVYGPMSLHPTA